MIPEEDQNQEIVMNDDLILIGDIFSERAKPVAYVVWVDFLGTNKAVNLIRLCLLVLSSLSFLTSIIFFLGGIATQNKMYYFFFTTFLICSFACTLLTITVKRVDY